MSLPTTLSLGGAGTSTINGVYTLSTGVDANGNHYYQKSSPTIYIAFAYGDGRWMIDDTLTGTSYVGSGIYYAGPYGDTNTSITLTGWVTNSNRALPPPPTLTSASAAPINLTVSQVY